MFRAPPQPRPLYQSIGAASLPRHSARIPRCGARLRPPTLRERAAVWLATVRLVWRWLWRLGLAGLVLAALVGGARLMSWVMDPARFPLSTVEITGDLDHIDRASLERRLLPAAAGGFFSVDVAAVADAARHEPWVKQALVRRVWPDKLVVEIVGRRSIARWADGGLLSDSGEVFAVAGPLPEQLPLLGGPAGVQPRRVYAEYQRFSRLLEGLPAVREVRQEARGAWHIGLANGMTITAGRKDVAGRLKRFAAVYRSRLAGVAPPLESVDLRYSDGFAVRFKPASEPDRKIMDL
ncbi:cell division protein FtsQ/DivIB [Immundisolibacter sp.]